MEEIFVVINVCVCVSGWVVCLCVCVFVKERERDGRETETFEKNYRLSNVANLIQSTSCKRK